MQVTRILSISPPSSAATTNSLYISFLYVLQSFCFLITLVHEAYSGLSLYESFQLQFQLLLPTTNSLSISHIGTQRHNLIATPSFSGWNSLGQGFFPNYSWKTGKKGKWVGHCAEHGHPKLLIYKGPWPEFC